MEGRRRRTKSVKEIISLAMSLAFSVCKYAQRLECMISCWGFPLCCDTKDREWASHSFYSFAQWEESNSLCELFLWFKLHVCSTQKLL